jgi:predicted NBD/HSP70 family sugar kinase
MKEFRSRQASTKAKHDERVIEAAVFRFGPISRANIQELTHLHPTTISHRVRELLTVGRLLEAGPASNAVGRKQVLLRLNEEHAFVVGVAFDDEHVLAGTMDLHPRLRSKVQQTTRLDGGPEEFEKQLVACARQAIKEAEVDIKSVLGIGVAGSGLMNSREGTLAFSATVGLGREIPLKQIFEKEFGVPAFVEHLGRAKAVAERDFGAGAGAEGMIYVEYGKTGIGAGIILDGRLVYGSRSTAGEIGHTHVLEDGPVCKCGSFGCLEAMVGAAALAARMRKAIADGSTSEALTLAKGDVSKISGFTVLEAARMGDKTSAALVEQVANYLGLALANMVNSLNPSTLVLDPRLSLAGPDLLDQVARVIKRQSLNYSSKDLLLCFGKLGIEASLLGLASLAIERHFEVPMLKPPRFMVETLPSRFRQARWGSLPNETEQGTPQAGSSSSGRSAA